MDDLNRAPAPSFNTLLSQPEETIDLTTGGSGGGSGTPASGGGGSGSEDTPPRLVLKTYDPDRQRDYVRLIVTVGLLAMLGFVIVWSCIETASWNDHWVQTKEMLQIILPALTGLIGSVIGFYFGSGVRGASSLGASNDPGKQ